MEKDKSQGPMVSDEWLTWEEEQRLRGEIGNLFSRYEDSEMQSFLRANPLAASVFDFELAAQLVMKGASLETLQMIIDSSPGAFRWERQGWASVQPPCTNLVTVACISIYNGRKMRETLEIIKYLVAKFPDFSVDYQDKENHDYVYYEDYRGAADHLIVHHLACWATDPPDIASRIEAMKLIHAIIPKAIAWAIDPDDGSTPLHLAMLSRHDTTDMVVWLLETYPEMASARTTDGSYLPLIYGLRFGPAFVRKKCFQKLIEANPSALSEVMRTHIL